MPPLKLCLDCGRLTQQSRCPAHRAARERARPPRPTSQQYDQPERKRRAQAVAEHRATYGDWCPGWHVPAHHSADLTADHIVSVGSGGSPGGPLQVLCRACNGRKSHR